MAFSTALCHFAKSNRQIFTCDSANTCLRFLIIILCHLRPTQPCYEWYELLFSYFFGLLKGCLVYLSIEMAGHENPFGCSPATSKSFIILAWYGFRKRVEHLLALYCVSFSCKWILFFNSPLYTIYASLSWKGFGSDNGLSPVRCQAITWNHTDLLSTGPKIFILENAFEYVVCEMVATLSWHQFMKWVLLLSMATICIV